MKVHLLLSALTCFSMMGGVAFGNTEVLMDDLLRQYKHKVRPVMNESTVVSVKLEIVPRRILYVSEVRQEIKVYFWLRQQWKDEFLTWDPSKYNGTTKIFVYDEVLWHPDIVLYQSNEAYLNVGTRRRIPLIVGYDGQVNLLTPQIYTTHCKMNLTYYPFDTQLCFLKFGSWAYNGNQLDISSLVEEAESSSYLHNGEWDLTSVSFERHVILYSCCPEPYPDVEYTLRLTRRPWFYVLNLIVPFITITLLSSLAFFIPPESGEKISLAVTSLLSLIVFTQLVMNTVPAASDGTHPVIALYFVVSVMIVSLVVVLCVVSLRAYHKKDSGQEIPKLVRFIVLTCMGNICIKLKCMQKPEPKPSHVKTGYNNVRLIHRREEDSSISRSNSRRNEGRQDVGELDYFDREFPIFRPVVSLKRKSSKANVDDQTENCLLRIESLFKTICQHEEEKKSLEVEEENSRMLAKDWVEVSKVFDRFFLLVFASLFCVLPIVLSLKCTGAM